MAKTNRFLTDLKEKILDIPNIELLYSSFEDENGKLKEFISILDAVEDSRMKNKCTYTTSTIVGIVFMGVLLELDSWVDIADFARTKSDIVSKYVDLSCGIPAHDTLMRVFSLINSETLEKSLVDFLTKSIETTAKILEIDQSNEMKHLAIDGKELKGSGRKYNTDEKVKNGQIMHFYDSSTGICIKSKLIDEKTNEIPTAKKVLAELNIKNVIITSDAMNCQKGTVEVIAAGKGHYVLGLKGNHGDFFNEIKDRFETEPKKEKKNYYKMDTEKNHNQVEQREFFMISAGQFVFSDGWKNIKNVVMYKKTMTNNHSGEEKSENRYYISDLNDIELISEVIRRHWSVENELHWHLDANFHEDANKTMNKKAACNLSIVKKCVLTLMKLMQPLYGNISIRRIKKHFTYNYEKYLFLMFTFLDEEKLKQIL